MLIGIDFDNTIICYDAVFHAVALEHGLISSSVPQSKQAVRDHLRQVGREDEWTAMQGYVYGCRLDDAHAMPGVIDALQALKVAGHEVAIVSHKTRHPYVGPAYDLHEAASLWLANRGIAGDSHCVVDSTNLFFEITKETKLNRIASLHCDHFVDDLPEFLCEPTFADSTQRWLFDPNDANADHAAYRRIQHWNELPRLLVTEAAA